MIVQVLPLLFLTNVHALPLCLLLSLTQYFIAIAYPNSKNLFLLLNTNEINSLIFRFTLRCFSDVILTHLQINKFSYSKKIFLFLMLPLV